MSPPEIKLGLRDSRLLSGTVLVAGAGAAACAALGGGRGTFGSLGMMVSGCVGDADDSRVMAMGAG